MAKDKKKASLTKEKARLRESAQVHLLKSRFEKALNDFRRLLEIDPTDLRIQLKIGDVLARMGKKAEAVKEYESVASGYAKDGLLIQAIAVYKLIVKLDPSNRKVEQTLADLRSNHDKGLLSQGIQPQSKLGVEKEAAQVGITEMEGEADLIELEEEPLPYIPLFSGLSSEEFSKMVAKMQVHRYPPKTLIIKEGTEGDSICFISEGVVRVFRYDQRGNKLRLRELKEGDFFGEFAYFADSKRHANVESLTEVKILEISKEDMRALIREHPGISEALFNFYKKRIMNTLLAFSPLFKDIHPKDRELLLDKCTRRVCRDNEMVIQRGDPGDSFYLVKSGQVKVFVEDSKKGRLTISVLHPGDFFGEIALITGKLRNASVQTVGKTELIRLSKRDFEEIMRDYPQIAKIIKDWGKKRIKDTMSIIRASEIETGLV